MMNKFLAKFFPISFAIACLCHSCTNRLSVRTEYLSHEQLASYTIKTPDPALRCPLIGQRLIVSWRLPKAYLAYPDLHLYVQLRWHTHEEIEQRIPIETRRGYYVYTLADDDYQQSGGVVTYQVEVREQDNTLEKWTHPLWKECLRLK